MSTKNFLTDLQFFANHPIQRDLRIRKIKIPKIDTNAASTNGLFTGTGDTARLDVPCKEYVTVPQFKPGEFTVPEKTRVISVFAGTEKL
jgi:hypothetical protein